MVVLLFQPCIKKEEEYSNMSRHDWAEYAKDFKESFDGDEDYIMEYVDSLIPVYFYDIEQDYKHYVEGNHLNIEIKEEHLGLSFYQIMQRHLFDEFMDRFMAEWESIKEDDGE